jgi:hypothetical protein
MKKDASRRRSRAVREMRPEYDFSKGVRGKHAARYAAGTNVVVLDPDVAELFPTSAAVNDALRGLVRLARRSAERARRPAKDA